MTQGKRYTITEFQQMVFDNTCVLNPEIAKLLVVLESQLDVSENANSAGSNKTPVKRPNNATSHHHGGGGNVGKSGDNKSKQHNDKKKKMDEEDWEVLRSFKATKLITKTGVDKRINDIRVLMNKMSPTNVETIEPQIMQYLKDYETSDDKNDESDLKLAQAILQVCVMNKFYDDLFARFYKKLMNNVELSSLMSTFQHVLGDLIGELKTKELVIYVDADVDYDAYCAYNKVIDTRKSKCVFVMNMIKHGAIEKENAIELIKWYLDLIMENIVLDNRAKEIEELAENVFVFVAKGDGMFNHHTMWTETLLPQIHHIGCSNNKQYPSISNRIIFKFKDILDTIST
jgi:hypothetical protein